ncbi:HAMP domain-containing sensor histidine kinase [Lipingzhangella sp. LS1_29]|uniref:Signal transduction histidine-protein kinase/phosphatase MprB n=1 Tax=Lipingzhangella rawalii TaxID=2055835 RepID=A0ABU2H1T4_9ACTN|nr:HAMP domain-containing sensor histidine kinase [Lipingzhangella rawalii]MDS1269253.1 HAMP domain-containing sensor histidine kinase [Lipingzhangella rawalii]
MLRRLLAVLLPLAVLLVAALGGPVGGIVAQQRTQDTYIDRLNDVGRFASLAETALSSDRTEALELELRRYAEVYDIPVALVDPAGEVVLASWPRSSPSPDWLAAPETERIVDQALAGYRPEPPTVVWPWNQAPMVVAEPVGRDTEVVGVVVAHAGTRSLAVDVLGSWAWIGLAALVPLAGLAAVTWPVSRWVLRPVRQLDEATAAVAEGDLATRVSASGGPPELRRLSRSFNTMVEVVDRALQRQRAFVSDASHQLRNPLASLRLAVENLGVYLDGPDARRAHTEAVEETKAMHRMLNSLLAATRLDSARQAEPVHVDEIMDTHAPRWRALAADGGIDLTINVPSTLVVLEPPGGLGSILDELVSNALRLSGGTRLEIGAGTGSEGADRVALWVCDDGIGLGADERSAALGRFWRSSTHQNTPGSGLGLAICAELVEAAGGRLWLESSSAAARESRPGLTVYVELPLVRDGDP